MAVVLYVRTADAVVRREVAGETFLVPIRGRVAELDDLFVVNEVGSWLWDRLERPMGLDEIVTGLVAEFEVDAERARKDAIEFIRQSVEAGLIVEVTGQEG